MASTTRRRAEELAKAATTATSAAGKTYAVVENFAVFIDTHRDQPHVSTFENDIHRGMARPTLVHYAPPLPGDPPEHMGYLIRVDDGLMIEVDPKHKFVEVDWWSDFVTDFIVEHGRSPVSTGGDDKGQLPTSHLRDARKKVYKLKSLRQIVRAHEKAAATATGTPFSPSRTGMPPAKAKRVSSAAARSAAAAAALAAFKASIAAAGPKPKRPVKTGAWKGK